MEAISPNPVNGLDLGIAMALEQARLALADQQRLVGLYFAGGDPRDAPGDHDMPEILIRPAGGNSSPQAGGMLTWQARARRSRARPGNHTQPFGSIQMVTAGEAADRLQQALAVCRGHARMIVASRTGGILVDLAAGRVRRSSLKPHDADELLARAAGLRQRSTATPGPPRPAATRAAAQSLHTHQGTTDIPPLGAGSLLDPREDGILLQAIGIVGPKGAVRRDQRRKYNQINHLVELLRGLLERLPRDRELVVVDAGCGKSQLLLILNYVLTEKLGRRARLIGLDAEPAAVQAARGLQQRMGYRNMDFIVTTIRGWRAPSRIDLVISLHACDVATDEALALGVASGAQGIVAVPCCQHELAPQLHGEELAPLLSHPILRARLADWLTDGLRVLILESHGYAVDVLEYVSPLDTPKNILLRAELTAGSSAPRAAGRRAKAEALMARFGVRPSLPGLIDSMRTSLDSNP